MIQLILILIAVVIIVAIFKKIGKALLYVLGALTALALFVVAGIQFALGYLTEKISKQLSIRRFVIGLMALISLTLATAFTFFDTHPTYGSYEFLSWRFYISFSFLLGCFVLANKFSQIFRIRNDFATGREKEDLFYLISFSSFFLSISCTLLFTIKHILGLGSDAIVYLDHAIWIISVFAPLAVLTIPLELFDIVNEYEKTLSNTHKIRLSELNANLEKDKNLLKDDIDQITRNLLTVDILSERLTEIDFGNDSWIFQTNIYKSHLHSLKNITESAITFERNVLIDLIIKIFGFSQSESNEYIDTYLEDGEFYNFQIGTRFVSYSNRHRIRTCNCCGIAEESANDEGDWICSDICKDTEKFCDDIKKKPYDKFISEASLSGFIVMSGAYAWSDNHKIVNPSSNTGHGFAAEKANSFSDTLKGKDSSVIGGDNAKNGADRIVNGDLIQTKYCRTAQKSVNQSFDNKGSGNYRYLDSNGKPMQLEVPKDQYDGAVKAMEEKIKLGKVPGVSDPNEAKNIVRKGSVTYEQARNITKFCTVESLTFDLVDGAVVGASAAGISFAITASIYYLNTKDPQKAIQTAALQAGKTFASTLVIYVSTQQLHRLESVVNVLNKIDVKHLPKSVKDFLSSGYGVNSSSLNKAIRGTVVTSAVVIAVSTGPDLMKMIRGRISGGQFLQNLSIVSSGVVSGTVGSIAGAAILSPLGPAAVFGGRIIGGFIGGHVGTFIASTIAGKLREDDRTQMIKLIKSQLEYLAVTFNLTKDELTNVQENLKTVANDEMLEKLFAAKSNRIAYANYCIKPIVVAVVKQRPILHFSNASIIESVQNFAA